MAPARRRAPDVPFDDDVPAVKTMTGGSGPYGQMQPEVGVGAGHPDAVAGGQAGQGPLDQQMSAAVESEPAQVNLRVGSRRR